MVAPLLKPSIADKVLEGERITQEDALELYYAPLEELGQLANVRRNRIKALLPAGTSIAHKTGTLANTASDVGFIETSDGRHLAVAIYVTGQGGKQGRDSRIALLARAIYDGYSAETPRRTVLR